MAWGDNGVSKLQYKLDSNTPWGTPNSPKGVTLIKSGILRQLRMIQRGALTYSGAPNASLFGPYNAYTYLELLGNAQQAVFRATGYGMYLINIVKRALEQGAPPVNTSLPSPIGVTDQDYIFDGQKTSAPANDTDWNWFLDLPIAQRVRSLGGDIGMIPLSTQNAQLQFNFTVGCPIASGTTYNLFNVSSSDNLQQPYYHASNTVTIANPTLELMKESYEPVQDAADFPNFDWVSQWLEEQPQTYSGSGFTWKQNQDAGILCRLIFGLWTNTTPFGVPTADLLNAGSIVLAYNSDTVKFSESGLDALARWRDQSGNVDLPQGCFAYDLLGPDLTWQDVLNTYVVPAIQLQMTLNPTVTLNTNVTPKVLAQRLMPIRITQ